MLMCGSDASGARVEGGRDLWRDILVIAHDGCIVAPAGFFLPSSNLGLTGSRTSIPLVRIMNPWALPEAGAAPAGARRSGFLVGRRVGARCWRDLASRGWWTGRVGCLRRRVELPRGHGAIINVSSFAGYLSGPGSAYGASKAWILAFTDTVAASLAGSGVQAIALCAGRMRTGRHPGNDRSAPGRLVWLDPDDVVDRCLADLRKGKALSVPGPLYRTAVIALRSMCWSCPAARCARQLGRSAVTECENAVPRPAESRERARRVGEAAATQRLTTRAAGTRSWRRRGTTPPRPGSTG
jgi:NAD(P)-dependent dehydrogenase (short-subunit alcohol dehydrogenase family)